ncbi:hypothetical protein EVA_13420 [gut metagenome]|uniref:Uncharacterized protein n=1 Tax=gut metagenome TaxID=749906 RepID=J9G9L4_9ZZZZ
MPPGWCYGPVLRFPPYLLSLLQRHGSVFPLPLLLQYNHS